jgi:preprotein translocase SecF subunit
LIKKKKFSKGGTVMNFDIVKNRKKFFALSIILIAIGFATMIFNGASGKGIFNFDIDFTGGTAIDVNFGKDVKNTDIAKVITDVTGQKNPQVQDVLGTDEETIKIQSVDSATRTKITDALKKNFNLTDDAILSVQDISGTVSGEMQKTAIIAVIIACIAMLIYITIRFKDFKMGVSSIMALVHDVCIMLAFYAVFRIPVNNSFIAALLTVLGYSINATIVVFDRVRENKGTARRMETSEIINHSVKQTLRRSIYTSLTTLFAIGAVYVFGVKSIREFALPMMVGIISGAYSSVLLAGSFWFTMLGKGRKKAR